ncbi:copper-binding protein [Rhizobium lusitanum]|uniref:Cu/Ag efflux protein CusF n=1 Tax=Rhizobium lusitanum TaxID=293958 RepID=A0A7X0IST7_9HYPH|nr:copper-binding protein [Rhizobium lusitanum]MBB6486117.1 Cu/Ag efflux protein CusF [Rhizobium lusitanum]
MKNLVKIALAAALTISAAAGAYAQEFTKGVVTKIDAKTNKVTIKHEQLKNLDMPAMTMVFRADDPAIRAKLKKGASIEFVAERVDGKLTVTQVK